MKGFAKLHWLVLTTVSLTSIASAWIGCAEPVQPDLAGSSSSSSSSGEGGTAGAGGAGNGGDISFGGMSGGTGGGNGACVTTSAESRQVPVDIIFLIDRSGSMSGSKWAGTTKALTAFFNDPASFGLGVGLVYFPAQAPDPCNPTNYAKLDVPVDLLPPNAFALTNSIPFSPLGSNTPTWPALKGTLMAATAYQDAHPTHKVIVVLATDGDPYGCEPIAIDDIAALASSARSYNGVRTYVIGVAGSTIANLNKIAAAGGTTAAYDVTQDIEAFSAKIADIRTEELGCDYEIPPPPPGEELVYDEVNFTYVPKGVGDPKIIPRADDLADCGNLPGWYYDSNSSPSKIILCPASCSTVQADLTAKVNVLFGCESILN